MSQPSAADVAGTSTPARAGRARRAWLLWTLALALGVGGGTAVALVLHGHRPVVAPATAAPLHDVATWPAGARPAPDFSLVDQHGTPFSLSDLRGRRVIVTFIDPLCRNLCPLEARILDQAVARLPAAQRPAIVAVSVDPWGDTPTAFADDRTRWQLPAEWRWGIGSHARLAAIWRRYAVGVRVTKKTLAGVTVRDVEHTEASYVLDASGHERALLVYPFRVADVLVTLRRLGAA